MTKRSLACIAAIMMTMLLLCSCVPAPTETADKSAFIREPVDISLAGTQDASSATSEPDYTVLRDEAVCSVLFIRAGKADAALVQAGEKNVLIDTGEDSSVPMILAALQFMDVDRLDAVFLTHTHSDHMGGFKPLASIVPIDRVYRAAISENKKDGSNKIDNAAEKTGIPVTKLEVRDTIALSDDVVFEVLGPRTYNNDDDNDNSLVLRLTAAGTRVLFAADMQFSEETSLMQAGTDLSADILKVGNHGNPDATGDGFAEAVSPRWAIIPTDRTVDTDSANPRVLSVLSDAAIFITDEFQTGVLAAISADGTVRFADPQREKTLEVTIAHLDRAKQLLTLQNEANADADLSGCILYSTRGGEVYRIPDGVRLAAGKKLTVSGENGVGDLAWTGEDKPWNTKKDDSAIFFDSFGNLLARFD